MKKIIFSLALVVFLSDVLKAEEFSTQIANDNEIVNSSDQESFNVLAPPRDDRGWRRDDRWRRDRRHRPGRPWRPGRDESWVCIANDSGTEEHYGGHAGYGYSQYEAARNAIEICRLSHGECYIANCTMEY